jgi:DNA-binding NarL/FixJ family response regulator
MALLGRIVTKEKRVLIVGSAADGHRAVCDARSLRPDLVITDLQMPRLDGAGATQCLKQGPNPPVVFVATSDDTATARARCMSAGADAFLVKGPNLAPQLLAAIQAFFPDTPDLNHIETRDFSQSLEHSRRL